MKDEIITLRLAKPEKAHLQAAAAQAGTRPGPLASGYVREGLRRSRFPAIEFRDGLPGRLAYLAGTRWPVWMIAELVEELAGDTAAAALKVDRPEALIKMALAYAAEYPEEIDNSRNLAKRPYEEFHHDIPHLERL